jgi:hypothetical protein
MLTTVTLLERAYGTNRWSPILRLRSNTRTGFRTFSVNRQTGYHSQHERKVLSLHMPRKHRWYMPPSNAIQNPIFQDGRSAWSRPQRCQLAGGGKLLEMQVRTGVKDLS